MTLAPPRLPPYVMNESNLPGSTTLKGDSPQSVARKAIAPVAALEAEGMKSAGNCCSCDLLAESSGSSATPGPEGILKVT